MHRTCVWRCPRTDTSLAANAGTDANSDMAGKVPDAQPVPGPEDVKTTGKDDRFGQALLWVKNVTRPTITVYSPSAKNTGVAVVVFPGGGFEGLAIDLEGTEVCDWLTSKGITCVLLKYRTPSLPYDWHCDCRPNGLGSQHCRWRMRRDQ